MVCVYTWVCGCTLCAYSASVEARGWCWMSSSIIGYLIVLSLTLNQEATDLAGQQTPQIHLTAMITGICRHAWILM